MSLVSYSLPCLNEFADQTQILGKFYNEAFTIFMTVLLLSPYTMIHCQIFPQLVWI